MRDGKSFASLSAGLLARKGEARPAMRRQAFEPGFETAPADDLGWNDMGDEPPAVVRQQAAIAREFADAVSAPSDRKKAAFTLRLDPERHLRLRLVCAARHRSAQQIVIQALDDLLARMPEAERLAASLGRANDAASADHTPGGEPIS